MGAENIEVLRWRNLSAAGVDAIVTTRSGGVSTGDYASLNLGLHVGDDPDRVIENRRRAAAALGAELDDMVFCFQKHANDVAVVGSEHRGTGARSHDDALPCDALVTVSPGVCLVVMVADCVPLVLFDPDAQVLACVHAGWGGTTKGVTPAAIEAMVSQGATPDSILAGIGPAIPGDRYQVGDDVLDAARRWFGDDIDDIVRADGTGRWLFDLWAANRRQLIETGLDPANIEVSTVCTGPGTPFYSDRAVRPCGRFAAIARLRSSDRTASGRLPEGGRGKLS